MLLFQIVKEVIPNADEAMTRDEIERMIQEISKKKKLLNGDWVKEVVRSTTKTQ